MRKASPGFQSKGAFFGTVSATGSAGKGESYGNIDMSLMYAFFKDMCSLSGLHMQPVNVAQLSVQNSTGTFLWGSLSCCQIYASENLEVS